MSTSDILDDDLLPWEEPHTQIESHRKFLEVHVPAPEISTTESSSRQTPFDTTDLWQSILNYLEIGFNVMIGRAEDEIINGVVYKAKSPLCKTWSSEPEKSLSREALSKILITATPGLKLAPIIICGKGSGNLWAIDIDISHWPGIDVRYFNAIRETNPELWKKLRIHKTPSGGYHVIYRTIIFVPGGNAKLAYKEDAKEAGIETRAHGGYIMAPPGMGYSVYKLPEDGEPISALTIEEHEFLINLAKLYNEKKKKVAVKSTKQYEEIYDENPFKHFNGSPVAAEVLIKHGWEIDRGSSEWIHFTRPGKKRGVSASFHKEKGFFHFFTTSTEFDGNKTYDGAAVRCILEYDGDYKKMYPVLVQEGYGIHKPSYEAKFIRKALQTGKSLPPNFSVEAKEKYHSAIEESSKKYPFGIFWEPKENDGYTISRIALTNVATSLGFSLLRREIIRIERPYFDRIKDERAVYDILKDYIKEEDAKEYEGIINAFDAFWQHNGPYIISRLPIVDEDCLLRSTYTKCYKAFNNTLLVIEDEIKEIDPSSLNKLIDRSSKINRDWTGRTDWSKCKYLDFLGKAINMDIEELQKVIGYLCWDYNDETQFWIIALMDEKNGRDGGESCKGVFCQLLRPWLNVKTIDIDEKYARKAEILQSWNRERILHINDVSKDFKLSILKAFSSEGTERKRLYKDLETIPTEDMPKLIISTQWGYDLFTDGGVKRRMIPIPFSGYFNPKRTPINEYGGKIPHVWSEDDFHEYDCFIAECILKFIATKRLDIDKTWNEITWKNSFDHTYGAGDESFREWLNENIKFWACDEFNGRGMMNKELSALYLDYCKEEGIKPTHTTHQLRKAIKSYCDHYGIAAEMGKEVRENQFSRGRGIIFECFS